MIVLVIACVYVRPVQTEVTHQAEDTRDASPKTMTAHDQFYEIRLAPTRESMGKRYTCRSPGYEIRPLPRR